MEIIEIRKGIFERKIKVFDIVECDELLYLTTEIQGKVLSGISFSNNENCLMAIDQCKLFEGSILISN